MRIGVISATVILFGLLASLPRQAVSQDAKAASVLKVHLNYTGSGTVDEKHKIYVVLWDSAAFVSGEAGDVMPVELQSATSKQGTVTFSDVRKVPAYLSTAFDKNGEWDGQSGPPPEGAILGLYSKTAGKPEPIEIKPGTTATVELSFDDSIKMPAAKPAK